MSQLQLLFCKLRIYATSNDMQMYHICDLRKISESVREKSQRDIQNGDDIDRTNKRQSLFTVKSFGILPGACSVTDRHFHVCCIRFNTPFTRA